MTFGAVFKHELVNSTPAKFLENTCDVHVMFYFKKSRDVWCICQSEEVFDVWCVLTQEFVIQVWRETMNGIW